eukprot:1045867-Prorocentrum_minimum.AAC.1
MFSKKAAELKHIAEVEFDMAMRRKGDKGKALDQSGSLKQAGGIRGQGSIRKGLSFKNAKTKRKDERDVYTHNSSSRSFRIEGGDGEEAGTRRKEGSSEGGGR